MPGSNQYSLVFFLSLTNLWNEIYCGLIMTSTCKRLDSFANSPDPVLENGIAY